MGESHDLFSQHQDQRIDDDELDRVAGGIIIVGGFLNHYQLFQPSSVIDRAH